MCFYFRGSSLASTIIFTFLAICITAISLKAQDTYMKLYGGEGATSFVGLNKTKEGNIFLLTKATGNDKQHLMLLNAAGDTLWSFAMHAK